MGRIGQRGVSFGYNGLELPKNKAGSSLRRKSHCLKSEKNFSLSTAGCKTLVILLISFS